MKLLTTAILMILTALYGQKIVHAQAITENQASFSFNQAVQNLNLETSEFETIYRTDHVPDTCYRDEVQGTRTECRTEYYRQCSTRNERVCENRTFPVCQTVPRNVCRPVEQCTTQMDRVCNSRGCVDVPRRVCRTVQQCSTQQDRVCHNETRYECRDIPREFCQNIPRQVCYQVPNVVRVPYACTRPVQVPAGQRLKLHTVAKVSLNLVNFAEVGALSDVLVAQLMQSQVYIRSAANTANYLYQIVGNQRTEQMMSETEKVINYVISIRATSLGSLGAFSQSRIDNTRLFLDHLEFSVSNAMLGNVFSLPVTGYLTIVQYRNRRSNLVMIDSKFLPRILVGRGNVQNLMFNNFDIQSLNLANHNVELSLSLDMDALKKDAINADVLNRLNTRAIEVAFDAYPIQ